MKLNYDEPLSNFAFNVNLRRHTAVQQSVHGLGSLSRNMDLYIVWMYAEVGCCKLKPFHNRSTTVSQPFHNRSTTVPQAVHNRSSNRFTK